mmetsp:Transcript_31665/g.69198  ORF Transcript_31665/g.69198 Transcript_31665/m.69198 type:complete len:222 (-) Transcript_31665:57-722(-)|eukprot:CAMPEP_0118940936 /NCGR_PEP_ID=MMETSP1169-20130426/32685_1 /TAXON_ID=36882 /ORGANISM="Pyramimonas obovata, Strain CCMP722" /LENGTH=221 /DNA_ID=CAMNT_0006885565 /DNA_START=211 /DNA_END=876 /DNA_ORIENTATION=+
MAINTRKVAKSLGYLAAGAAVAGAAYSLLQYYSSTGAVECLVDDDEDLPEVKGNHCKLLRFRDYRWNGVETQEYKAEGTAEFKDILRTELVGKNGESCKFHVRYFEVGPGGYSTMEKHVHEHVVIPLRGEGICMMEGVTRKVRRGDVIYVAPSAPHQLLCAEDQKQNFGFLCIVNADRDRPVALRQLKDGSFEEVLGAVSACEFKPKHLRKPGDAGYVPPK